MTSPRQFAKIKIYKKKEDKKKMEITINRYNSSEDGAKEYIIIIKEENEEVRFYTNFDYELSRILTGTVDETGNGIFSSFGKNTRFTNKEYRRVLLNFEPFPNPDQYSLIQLKEIIKDRVDMVKQAFLTSCIGEEVKFSI